MHMSNFERGMEWMKNGQFAKAYEAFAAGAAEGDAACMCQQALALLNGRGVQRDNEQALRLLQRSAEAGCGDAYFHLSNLAYMGHCMPKNDAEGYRLLLAAVDLHSPLAEMRLSTMIAQGKAPGTQAESLRLLTLAADKGVPEAVNMLGVLYVQGNWVPRDGVRAQQLFLQAHQMGLAEATYNLSMTYADGVAGNADIVKSTDLLRQAAEHGYAKAYHLLSTRYAEGRGVSRDLAKAREWLNKSVMAGNPEGENMYGNLLLHGAEGIARDVASAKLWFEKAAAQGHAGAMNNLGVLLLDGTCGQRDEAQAARLFAQAREKGNPDGSFNLGLCTATGRGVPRDDAKSFELFVEAMRRGHRCAPAYVGFSLVRGVGVAPDAQEGMRILREAVNSDERTAHFHYALCLLNGWGIQADEAEGMRHLQIAADKGYVPAKQQLQQRQAKTGGISVAPVMPDASRTAQTAPQAGQNANVANAPDVQNAPLAEVDALVAAGKSEQALAALKRLAEQGNSQAMVRLGDMYRTGEGMAVDPMWACVWYERASAKGDLMADYHLACMLWSGLGTPINQARAVKLWTQCALLGLSDAQYQLALALRAGREGEAPDPKGCIQWATKAAQQNHKEACLLLAQCYSEGYGVTPNPIKADYWRGIADSITD